MPSQSHSSLLYYEQILYPFSCLGQLIAEVSTSHTIRHTPHSVGLLCTSDQPVIETATYTTNTIAENPCPQRSQQTERLQTPRLRPHCHRDRPEQFSVRRQENSCRQDTYIYHRQLVRHMRLASLTCVTVTQALFFVSSGRMKVWPYL